MSNKLPVDGTQMVAALRVEITRWVDDDQPGFVECRLIDAHGRDWRFVGKLPYFTAADLDSKSDYPQPGIIDCHIERSWADGTGRELCSIDTDQPLGIEATSGETQFEVLATQLCEQ